MPTAATENAQQEAIKQLYARWFGAMESADVDGLLALLADDFLLKGPGQPPVSDRAVLRRALEEFHASLSEQVEYRIEEAHVAGDWAWVRISERAELTPKQGGEPVEIWGTHLAILARQPDGSWKVARDISSLDQPA